MSGLSAADRSGPAVHRALIAWVEETGLDDPAVRLHLGHVLAALDAGEHALVVEMTLGIGEALAGDWRPFLAVAAANHAFALGLELLDHVGDRALHADWRETYGDAAPDVATLASITLISCLPPLLLEEAALSPSARAEAARLASLGLWGAIRGQTLDLTTAVTSAPPSSAADEICALKNGAQLDLVAILPVLAASERRPVAEEVATALRTYVLAIGRASQLATELADLFAGERSRDVANGRATQPLLRALESLAGADRDRLLAHLTARAATGAGLAEIRDLVTRAGVATRCSQDVERHLHRAHRALDEAKLDSLRLRRVIELLAPLWVS